MVEEIRRNIVDFINVFIKVFGALAAAAFFFVYAGGWLALADQSHRQLTEFQKEGIMEFKVLRERLSTIETWKYDHERNHR